MDAPSAAELPAAVEKLESENQLLQIKNAVSASVARNLSCGPAGGLTGHARPIALPRSPDPAQHLLNLLTESCSNCQSLSATLHTLDQQAKIKAK